MIEIESRVDLERAQRFLLRFSTCNSGGERAPCSWSLDLQVNGMPLPTFVPQAPHSRWAYTVWAPAYPVSLPSSRDNFRLNSVVSKLLISGVADTLRVTSERLWTNLVSNFIITVHLTTTCDPSCIYHYAITWLQRTSRFYYKYSWLCIVALVISEFEFNVKYYLLTRCK